MSKFSSELCCSLSRLFAFLLLSGYSFANFLIFFSFFQNAIQRAHAAWLEGKIDKTGVMIHDVISEVDMGKPILVREIPFLKGQDEDLDAFERRVHAVEWGVVIEGVGLVVQELQGKKQNPNP